MRRDRGPVAEALRAALLELLRQFPPPRAGSEARRLWWHTLVGALGQVVREVDRAAAARERDKRKFRDSDR